MSNYFDLIKHLVPSGDELRTMADAVYNEIGVPTGFLTAIDDILKANLLPQTFSTAGDERLDVSGDSFVKNCGVGDNGDIVVDMLEDYVWEQLNTKHWKDVPYHWRTFYAMIMLVKIIIFSKQRSAECQTLIKWCDTGLLMGDPAVGKILAAIANELQIRKMQTQHKALLDATTGEDCSISSLSNQVNLIFLPGNQLEVPRISKPSLECFYQQHFQPNLPLVISHALDHWPALNLWSPKYIYENYGARTVPVEIGSKYTAEDWTQKLMTIGEFVEKFMQDSSKSVPIGYMAQHMLFDQIPELKRDIRVPEYCSLGESEDVEINAWFGPAFTVTPTHYDAKHNLLAQVFGSKIVRLFPPSESQRLNPHENDSLLFNTSQVDMEDPSALTHFPLLSSATYADVVLSPGSMLYIPPKWWHFVKSLSPSFSVSFWFY